MSRTRACSIGLGLAGLALATGARADDVNVTTAIDSMKVGAEFRSEMIYKDHGLQKVDGFDPKSTTALEVQTAKLKLSGNINKNTEFKFRFNALSNGASILDYGYGTYSVNKMFGFSVGRQKLLQGGFDHIDGGFADHANGVYQQNLAFADYVDMVTLHLNVAGQLQLQVFNDVVRDAANTTRWATRQHPSFVVGWRGELGPVSPLLNFGSYDDNHSRWIDVGVKTDVAGVNAQLDVYMKNEVERVMVAGNTKPKKVSNDSTAVTLQASYTVKDVAMPWIYFSTFDTKQGDDAAAGRKDVKFNSTTVDTTGASTYGWNDNGQTIGVGTNLLMLGKGWTPYVALVHQSGKWEDPKKAGATKDKSEMTVRLGVLGEI